MTKVHDTFFDGEGREVKGGEPIFPIFTFADDQVTLVFHATGFFISNYGFFATAKHNLFRKDGSLHEPLHIVHFYEPGKYKFRTVQKVHVHPKSA